MPLLSSFAVLAFSSSLLISAHAEDMFKQCSRSEYGIKGEAAPELKVQKWINLNKGKEAFTLEGQRGKIVYLYFFQSWCPGCHSHGFPTLQKMTKEFGGDDEVVFAAVQTTFEGASINTAEKAWATAKRYELDIPFGHVSGGNGQALPIMRDFRTGGTPWTVIVAPDGTVVYNHFHITPEAAGTIINELKHIKAKIEKQG